MKTTPPKNKNEMRQSLKILMQQEIGFLLRHYRSRGPRSQAEVAELALITRKRYLRLERGEALPTTMELLQLAWALGTTPNKLTETLGDFSLQLAKFHVATGALPLKRAAAAAAAEDILRTLDKRAP